MGLHVASGPILDDNVAKSREPHLFSKLFNPEDLPRSKLCQWEIFTGREWIFPAEDYEIFA